MLLQISHRSGPQWLQDYVYWPLTEKHRARLNHQTAVTCKIKHFAMLQNVLQHFYFACNHSLETLTRSYDVRGEGDSKGALTSKHKTNNYKLYIAKKCSHFVTLWTAEGLAKTHKSAPSCTIVVYTTFLNTQEQIYDVEKRLINSEHRSNEMLSIAGRHCQWT